MFISVLQSKALKTVAIVLFLFLASHQMADGADHLIPSWESVDEYSWTYGCTPTAAAMVLSYWDNTSYFGRLIDYYYTNRCSGNNVPNAIDELASCMKTEYDTSACTGSGVTNGSKMQPGFQCVTNKTNGYSFAFSTCSDFTNPLADWCWEEMKAEIDAGRPFVWSTGGIDPVGHSVATWGYRDDKYVILYDTWGDGRVDWYYANYLGTDFLVRASILRVYPGGYSDSEIELDDPIGGEWMLANSLYTINWKQWGTSINYVDLYYSEDEGVNWTFIGGTNSAEGWNSYTWQVPNISSTTARVRILGFNNSTYMSGDGSLGNFNISMPSCSDLRYPAGEWQRVWYIKSTGYCIHEGPSEIPLYFDYDWGTGVVAWGRSDDIELRSSRMIYIPDSGDYRFVVGSDDGVRLWIDNVLKLDKWIVKGYTTDNIDVTLSSGGHLFRLDYFENMGSARLSFNITRVPDLVVQSITTTPTSLLPSQDVSVTVTVKNQGPANAGFFYVDIYKNRDTAPAVGTVGDAWCALSGLAAGATASCTQSVSYASEGTYKVWAQVDTDDRVSELSENNNVFGPESIVVTPFLSVTPSDGFSSSGSQGGPFTPSEKTYTLTNNSEIAINWTASRGGWFYSFLPNGSLGTGASTTVRVYLSSLANSLEPGSYSDTVTFTNTTNGSGNTTRPVSLKVTATGSRPDLIEKLVGNPPASAVVGSWFPVKDTVANQGVAPASAFDVGYYLSVDKVAKTQLLTGSRPVTSLAGGATDTGMAKVTVPGGTEAGTYYLLACADYTSRVAESNETNNCIASSSTILVSGVDLIETLVSNPPASVAVGGRFSVTDTVVNQGNSSASAFKVGYYLSVDKVAKTQLLTGSRPVKPLAAGATSSGSATVTVPAKMVGGTYYLLACADYDSAVSESNESNNCLASSSTVYLQEIYGN